MGEDAEKAAATLNVSLPKKICGLLTGHFGTLV